jgi:hypothetical protein
MIDLIALVPDRDIDASLHGLLADPARLGIAATTYEIARHVRHDPGVRRECALFLRPYIRLARYALVVLDHEGSGHHGAPSDLELDLQAKLTQNGWERRCAAVVIQPEVENWIWSDSRHVDTVLGWPVEGMDLRDWLVREGYLLVGQSKPQDPKGAMVAALRKARKRPSSAHYGALAASVDFRNCTDPAFQKLLSTLRAWFPGSES